MDSVAEQMIELLISKCKSKNIKRGLEIALDIISTEGYYNMSDWEEMSDKEQWDEVKGYLCRK